MKKTLALILGVIMLMGCLSVSAAPSKLAVNEIKKSDLLSISLSGDATYDRETNTITSAGTKPNSGATISFKPSSEKISAVIDIQYTLESNVSNWTSNDGTILNQISGGSLVDLRWQKIGGDNGNPRFTVVGGGGANKYYPLYYGTRSINVHVRYDVPNGVYSLWVNGTEVVTNVTPRTEGTTAASIHIGSNDQGSLPFAIKNFRYTIEGETATNAAPAVGEEIFAETFDARVDFPASVPVTNGRVTLNSKKDQQLNGILEGSTTSTNGEVIWEIDMKENNQPLEGEYVVEAVLVNPTGGENHHRFTVTTGAGTMAYIFWSGSQLKGLGVRRFAESNVTTDLSKDRAIYGADGNRLKVSVHCNTVTKVVDIYFNGIKAWTYTFNDAANTKIAALKMNAYGNSSGGGIGLDSVRVYRPATFNETGVKITEDADDIKIETNAAKAGRLYFATYEGAGLNAIGSTELSMVPGIAYRVSKADWAGAKAFFWDADQKPLVGSWDLQ